LQFSRFVAASLAVVSVFETSASAQTIIDDWATVKAPALIELKPAKVDPKTTALLVLDLVKQTCNAERRPRCLASLPKVAKFLADARSRDMPVVYSLIANSTKADIDASVAPKGDEPIVMTVANKFIRTDLDKILKDRGIANVIVVGTTAEGAVLYTASEAAFLGYKVIVPVDGASAGTTYAEQAVAWTLSNAPGVANNTTLTKFEMIQW
jgi:nicotinamidase-related amidase